jgi:TolB-like protein
MTFLFAGHELDLPRQELRRAGEVVHVEPQVFDLLALLIRNRDRIVSKDEILDVIWQGRIVSEAALSSRINAARKAIGDNGNDQALIRTFHKRGFRFVGEASETPDADSTLVQANRPAEPARAKPGTDLLRSTPSLVVLPFDNLSGNPEHAYFCYGLTEDIIRLLGRNRWLTVLSRHSAAGMAAQGLEAAEVGQTLGVRYVVAGSVRRSGSEVRILVELVEAGSGRQLWSEVYDLDLPDLFEIRDAMARQIAAIVEPEVGNVERELALRKEAENLDAWDCYQRGFWHLWGFTNPGFDEAEQLFRRAIAVDPGFARAHAALAYVLLQKAFYGDPRGREALLQAAYQGGRTAVQLDERDCLCHCVLGRAHTLQRRYEEGIAALEHTIELNPSFAQGYFALAFALVWAGREDEAVALSERAVELSPRDPHLWSFHHVRAMAHFSLEELESAAHFARKATRLPNATHFPQATLLSALGLLGRAAEAEATLTEILERQPAFTLSAARSAFFFANDPYLERFLEGLRRAGLPD